MHRRPACGRVSFLRWWFPPCGWGVWRGRREAGPAAFCRRSGGSDETTWEGPPLRAQKRCTHGWQEGTSPACVQSRRDERGVVRRALPRPLLLRAPALCPRSGAEKLVPLAPYSRGVSEVLFPVVVARRGFVEGGVAALGARRAVGGRRSLAAEREEGACVCLRPGRDRCSSWAASTGGWRLAVICCSAPGGRRETEATEETVSAS